MSSQIILPQDASLKGKDIAAAYLMAKVWRNYALQVFRSLNVVYFTDPTGSKAIPHVQKKGACRNYGQELAKAQNSGK